MPEFVYGPNVIDSATGDVWFRLPESQAETAPLIFSFGALGQTLFYGGMAYDKPGNAVLDSEVTGDLDLECTH